MYTKGVKFHNSLYVRLSGIINLENIYAKTTKTTTLIHTIVYCQIRFQSISFKTFHIYYSQRGK